MIISAPTGLYLPILPKSPSESGNISYVISNNDPPRSSTTFIQFPGFERIFRESDLVYDKEEKRVFAGELIYDITKPSESIKGSGVAQFEIGQVLEFSEESVSTDSSEVDTYNLDRLELRQDLKAIDYESVGLSKSDYEELVSASLKRLNEITDEIGSVGASLKSNNSLILKNQADINNANSLLNNIEAILGATHASADKVRQTLEDLESTKSELLSERQSLQLELASLRDELNKVREVVR
jgi:chromosome segregation ATPase